MAEFLSEAVDTNAKLTKAWKKLDRLGEVDHLRASEEFDHLGHLLDHFNNTLSNINDLITLTLDGLRWPVQYSNLT